MWRRTLVSTIFSARSARGTLPTWQSSKVPEESRPAVVIADGSVVEALDDLPRAVYPSWAFDTVHIGRRLVADDFALRGPEGASEGDELEVTTIYPGLLNEGRLLPGTEKQRGQRRGVFLSGEVHLHESMDCALAAVVDRHSGTGGIGRALVVGFGIKSGAFASTVNHDNHNLVVIGTDTDDMAVAANAVAHAGGGLALAKDGEVLQLLPLPIAGLLSEKSIGEVAAEMDRFESLLVSELGVSNLIPQPVMLMQMFALANIPTLGLTDLGLVDVLERCTIPTVTQLSCSDR